MSVIINASTTSGLVQTADLSGGLNLQSNSTNVVTIAPTTLTTTLNSAASQAPLITQINGTEAMRVDSSGNLLVGTTSSSNTPSQGITAMQNTNIANIGIGHANGTSNGNTYMNFCYNGTQIGTIFQATTSSVTYQTTSDYRLKENVKKLNNGLLVVNSLNPVTYTWKRGNEKDEGFIAHELQEFVPNAVSGEKDQINEDGSIKPQGIDYGKLVPFLTAAIQELNAKVDAQAETINALTARIVALEAK